MEERLTDMEIKLAYQEQIMASLSEVITEQGKEIEGLQKAFKILNKQVFQWIEESSNIQKIPHQKPPHY